MMAQTLLYQQCRINHRQAILMLYSFLCHRLNTVTSLSIDFAANPVGCHDRTNSRYGNMTSYFAQKLWPSKFDTLIFFVPPFSCFGHFIHFLSGFVCFETVFDVFGCFSAFVVFGCSSRFCIFSAHKTHKKIFIEQNGPNWF